MSSLPSSVDVAIIGAGAAGLGAANALKNSGLSPHCAGSARPRRRSGAHDPGGARRPVRRRLRLAAFGGQELLRRNRRTTELRDRQNPAALARAARTGRHFRQPSATTTCARSTNSTSAPGKPRRTARTAPADRYLEPGNRWNPMIDAISTYVNGCELDRVSILDMDAYEDTNINWRVRRGYGALMAAYGAHLARWRSIAQVTLIDHSGKARADRNLARHARGGQGDRHRADQPDRRRSDPVFSAAAGKRSTPRAACRSALPTR